MNHDVNKKIILTSRPNGMPNQNNFKLVEEKIPNINYGEVLIKNIWLSLDPYMRGRMNDTKSYAKPIQIGDVITGGAVGEVISSKCKDFNKGDIVEGFSLGWQEYSICSSSVIRKIDPNLAPIQTALGVLGMPGLTAYFGLFHIGKPIPGDTIVVSAASGAVGQIVGQLAKIAGCKILGIAGGKEKCKYVKEVLNFDYVIDYKSENINNKIKEYCPEGINVYFDNVGGEISDAVINNLAPYAKIAVCGVISQYNLTEVEKGIRPNRSLLTNQAKIEGFLVFQFSQYNHIALPRLANWLRNKQIIWKEDIVNGLANSPSAFIGLMNGKNFGKLLIKL